MHNNTIHKVVCIQLWHEYVEAVTVAEHCRVKEYECYFGPVTRSPFCTYIFILNLPLHFT